MRAESSLNENSLGQVIIRARIQALDAVFHPRALGQHQHRKARLFRTQVTQHTDAVQLWQVQVKDHDVVFELRRRRPRLFAIRHNVYRIIFAFKTLANEFRQRFVIFRNKNSHNVNRP